MLKGKSKRRAPYLVSTISDEDAILDRFATRWEKEKLLQEIAKGQMEVGCPPCGGVDRN